jgi:hypothetical protein
MEPPITQKQLVFIDRRTKELDYQIDFNTMNGPYKNVTKIELLALSFPKIQNENYIVISLGNCDDHIDSNNTLINRKSCVVYFDNSNMGKGEYKTIYPIAGNGRTFVQNPIIHSLNKLNVKFSSGNPKPESGGPPGDISNFDINNQTTHSFLLEITYESGSYRS